MFRLPLVKVTRIGTNLARFGISPASISTNPGCRMMQFSTTATAPSTQAALETSLNERLRDVKVTLNRFEERVVHLASKDAVSRLESTMEHLATKTEGKSIERRAIV
jgi:hypothetical protein